MENPRNYHFLAVENRKIPPRRDVAKFMSDRKTEFITGIFQEWYGSLCRFLTQKLGCKEDTMDVAQEAYVCMLCLEHPEKSVTPGLFFTGRLQTLPWTV